MLRLIMGGKITDKKEIITSRAAMTFRRKTFVIGIIFGLVGIGCTGAKNLSNTLEELNNSLIKIVILKEN